MCTVCGCSEGEMRIEGHAHEHHDHHHEDHHEHSPHKHLHHEHDHHSRDSETAQQGDLLHYGQGPARAHAPGLSQQRMVQIEQNILSKNDQYAAQNRERFLTAGQLAVNLVSSPGSGKTTLLSETLKRLDGEVAMAVIEGDQQTSHDAERIRETGVQAVQINTGKGCHLDAHMVGHALDKLALPENGLLFIENVGNLVCPAAFDLGEAHKIAILSITEGEDKPLKYPDMFAAADVMILNKIDLLPYLDFDMQRCIDYARRVNPDIEVISLSARTGDGMDLWLDWLHQHRRELLQQQVDRLKQRLDVLNQQLQSDS